MLLEAESIQLFGVRFGKMQTNSLLFSSGKLQTYPKYLTFFQDAKQGEIWVLVLIQIIILPSKRTEKKRVCKFTIN